MDWFLYDNSLRHERVKGTLFSSGCWHSQLTSFIERYYVGHFIISRVNASQFELSIFRYFSAETWSKVPPKIKVSSRVEKYKTNIAMATESYV